MKPTSSIARLTLLIVAASPITPTLAAAQDELTSIEIHVPGEPPTQLAWARHGTQTWVDFARDQTIEVPRRLIDIRFQRAAADEQVTFRFRVADSRVTYARQDVEEVCLPDDTAYARLESIDCEIVNPQGAETVTITLGADHRTPAVSSVDCRTSGLDDDVGHFRVTLQCEGIDMDTWRFSVDGARSAARCGDTIDRSFSVAHPARRTISIQTTRPGATGPLCSDVFPLERGGRVISTCTWPPPTQVAAVTSQAS